MQKRLLKQIPKLLMLVALLFGVNSFGQALSENFSALTSGSNTLTNSQSSTTWSGNTNFTATTLAYPADGMVKLGSSNGNGSITSKSLDLSGGTFTVTFSVKGWSAIEGSIKVTAAGTSQTASYTALIGDALEVKTLTFTGGTATTIVKIETTAKRAFIDNVIVQIAGPAVTTTTADAFTTNGTTTGATLNGTINPNNTGAVNAKFQYGTATGVYGTALDASTPIVPNGTSAIATSLPLTGLAVNTRYFYRAVGTQGTTTVTTTNGTEASFWTLANQPGTPTVSNATLTTLDVTIAPNGNPTTGTTYVIQVVGGGNTKYVQTDGSLGNTEAPLAVGTRTITGLANATAYSFSVKALNGATTAIPTAYSGTANGTTLANTTPSITTGGTIAALSTTYGTASGPSTFTVSSLNLTTPVIVTAPTGFEVSLSSVAGATYTQTVSVTANSTDTPVYIRLSATAAATSYNGNTVTLSNTDATTVNKAIANSTVSQKALTISNLNGGTKVYDRTATAPVTGNAILSATANGDIITLGGSPVYTFTSNNANVGTNKPITVTGYTISGTNAANYTLTQPTNLTGSVTAKPVSATSLVAAEKTYDGVSPSTTTVAGTINGFISGDNLSLTGTFDNANAGNGKTVTVTLTGTDAANYSLPVTTTTGNIAKGANPLSATAIGLTATGTYTLPGSNITNNVSNGVLTYSLNNQAFVTLNGTTLTGNSEGTATLTINQAEGTNYNAVSITTTVTVSSFTQNDYRTTGNGTWSTQNTGTATFEKWNGTAWASSGRPTTTASNVYIRHTLTTNGNTSVNSIIVEGPNETGATPGGNYNVGHTGTISTKTQINNGGIITVAANFTNSGEFTVENNGTVIVNDATITGTSSVWNGTENFKPGSNFIIQNWSYGNRIIASGHKFSANANGYYFGNLTINSPTVNFAVVDSREIAKISENNFTVNNTGAFTVSLTNNSSTVTFGGNLIINSGLFVIGSTGSPTITVNGNISLNAGTFNFSQTSSSNTVIRVDLKGNLSTVAGTSFTSGDPDSKLVFSGNTIQTVSLATLGSNVAFEIANGAEVQLIDRNLALSSTNPFIVLTGGTLAFNNFNVTGAGAFTLQAGGTIKITDAAGVTTTGTATGNVQTATRTYAAGGNYTYVGSAAQVFGNAVSNAGVITIDKTNATDVVTASVVPTLASIVVNKGVLNTGTVVLGGATTNLTIAANGKYITSGIGTKPDANGTYIIDPAATVEFTGANATNIRVDNGVAAPEAKKYGKVIVTGTNVGLSSTTAGLQFVTGGSFDLANGSTFNVGNTAGFSGGAATAITTTGTPAITLGETSTVAYNGTAAQTITAFNTTTGEGTEGYGNLAVKNSSVATLGANLVYARNNVTIEGTANVTVASGKTLKIKNELIKNSGTFSIENNGALLQVNDVDNTGSITVTKDSNPLYYLDYTLWSTPVISTQTLANFAPETISTRFYEYGVTNGSEYYINIPAGNVAFTPAKGYLIRTPDLIPSLPNYNQGTVSNIFVGHFRGVPNNGEVTIAANNLANRNTAVGNPYPSPINILDFFTTNSQVVDAGSGIYLWRKRNGAHTPSYATITLAGMTLAYTPNPAGNGNAVNQGAFYTGNSSEWTLSQGQGFFVKTKRNLTGTPQIVFNNAMRRPAPVSGEQAFFRTAQSTTSRLWLNLTNTEGGYGQSAIAYIDGATTGLDYGYDGKMFAGANEMSIYSVAESTKLAIQARPLFDSSDVVPMGYVANAAGQYTITLDHTDGVFSNDQNVYVRDNALGLVHNVTDGAYTFTTEAGTFNERFDVVYTTDALGTTTPQLDANAVIIYKNGNALNINAGTAVINDVTVFDIRGRKLVGKTGVNAVETVLTGLDVAQQVLIIEVTTTKGKVSKKIVY